MNNLPKLDNLYISPEAMIDLHQWGLVDDKTIEDMPNFDKSTAPVFFDGHWCNKHSGGIFIAHK